MDRGRIIELLDKSINDFRSDKIMRSLLDTLEFGTMQIRTR